MEILFEDGEILVAIKPREIISESAPDKSGFADQLADYTHGYVGTIHRLDRGVGGVTVYAKTPTAAAALSNDLQKQQIKKQYLAAIEGIPDPAAGEMKDLLYHDRNLNKTIVTDVSRPGAKNAILNYEVLESHEWDGKTASLVKVDLVTGRTHQIRAQFSSRDHSLLGDRKYGSTVLGPIGLACFSLDFRHPVTKDLLHFEANPHGNPWEDFFPIYFNTKKP